MNSKHLDYLNPVLQRVRRCLMRLPLQDGRQMKEEAIERVAKHIVIESYDSGKDIVMKGKRNRPDFKFIA